jgi:ribonuclease HI
MTDHADGAETTAIALLMVGGTSEDQAKVMARERRRSQAMYHIAFLQTGNSDALVKGFARCTNEYMPVQEAVLAALRAYAEQGKQDRTLWSQMIIDAIEGRLGEPERPPR